MKWLILCGSILVMISCQDEATVDTGQHRTAVWEDLECPSKSGGEPNLFVSEKGRLYLTWVEYLDDSTDVLLFSTLENDRWSVPREIARGTDWFVNWADFPSLVSYRDGGRTLAAHWLQKSDQGVYDYDIRISQSTDGGATWNASFVPHRDGVAAEHGFVSMVPLDDRQIFATWLDGRNTKGGTTASSSEGHGHQGAMTLRAAVIDVEGRIAEEVELDNRVCDCCQTTAALTSDGPIVAYRDRSEQEIRDIGVVRKVKDQWMPPALVAADNWKIAGCPVNGPRIAAMERGVALGWYTNADKEPKIKVAFSDNAGANFGEPVRIDDGHPLGRVDIIMLSPAEALVSWLEKTEGGAEIRVVKVTPAGKSGKSLTVTASNASRQSGFPVMEKTGNQVVIAWTFVNEEGTRVKTARMKI